MLAYEGLKTKEKARYSFSKVVESFRYRKPGFRNVFCTLRNIVMLSSVSPQIYYDFSWNNLILKQRNMLDSEHRLLKRWKLTCSSEN